MRLTYKQPYVYVSLSDQFDSQSKFLAPLADMQCRLCQEVNNEECIKRFCWETTVDAAAPPQPTGIRLQTPVLGGAQSVPNGDTQVPREALSAPVQLIPGQGVGETQIVPANLKPVDVPRPDLTPVPNTVPLSQATENIPEFAMIPRQKIQDQGTVTSASLDAQIHGQKSEFPKTRVQTPVTVPVAGPVFPGLGTSVGTNRESIVQIQTVLPDNETPVVPKADPIDVKVVQLNEVVADALPVADLRNHMNNRHGHDLVRNTLADHPLNTQTSMDKMFESRVDKISKIHFGEQLANKQSTQGDNNLPKTIPREASNPAVSREPVNQIRIIPLSSDILRQMIQTTDQSHPSSAQSPLSPPADIEPEIKLISAPSIPLANDVFGNAPTNSPHGEHEQHTLVLTSEGQNGNTVGIVIGETNHIDPQLSLLETSGQLPSDHPAISSNGSTNTDQTRNDIMHRHDHHPLSHSDLHTAHTTSGQSGHNNAQISSMEQGHTQHPIDRLTEHAENIHVLISNSDTHHDKHATSENTVQHHTDRARHMMPSEVILESPVASEFRLGEKSQVSRVPHVQTVATSNINIIASDQQNAANKRIMDQSQNGVPVDLLPASFVEAILRGSTTPIPTRNPIRKAQLQEWGSQFIPANI